MKQIVGKLYSVRGYPNSAAFTDFKTDLFANGSTPAMIMNTATTTGLTISGATTNGILITGNSTDAIKLLTGTFTRGINLGGTIATGMLVGACSTTGIDFALTVGTAAGDANACLIRGGYPTTGGHTAPSAPIVFATANQHALQFYCKSTASQFTGIEMNAYTSAASASTQWANPCVAGEFTVRSLKSDGAVDNMWAGLFQCQILGANYGPAAGKQMIAGLFKTGVAATANNNAGNGALSAGVYIDTGFARASTNGDFGLFIISNNSASVPLTSFMHFAGELLG
jgi:hypothetical protein